VVGRAPRSVRGFASAEWIVAVALLFVLVGLSARLIAQLTQSGFAQLTAAEWGQQASLAGRVLRTELRRGRAGFDWSVHSGDSVSLRAFRGTGWICGRSPTVGSTVQVVFTGDRGANPSKDSVLVVGGEASAFALKVHGRRTRASCPGVTAPQIEEWDLSGPPPLEAVLRLFESGTYSVASGALRYRVGRGGRQPVAGSAFDTASGLAPSTGGLLQNPRANLFLVGPSGPYRDLSRGVSSVLWGRRSP